MASLSGWSLAVPESCSAIRESRQVACSRVGVSLFRNFFVFCFALTVVIYNKHEGTIMNLDLEPYPVYMQGFGKSGLLRMSE